MNVLADKVHKQEMPHMGYALHTCNTAMHIIQQPSLHIHSSGTPVGTKFTATYVGMVVEYCGHVMEYISLCAWHILFLFFVSKCIH